MYKKVDTIFGYTYHVNMKVSEIQEKADPVLRSYHVRKASVFGSVARGEEGADSDVDMLVEFGEPLGMIRYARFVEQLEQVLQKKSMW